MKQKFFIKKSLLLLLVWMLILTFMLMGCQNADNESQKDDLVIGDDDFNFVLDAKLLNAMSESGQNSLVVFKRKFKT